MDSNNSPKPDENNNISFPLKKPKYRKYIPSRVSELQSILAASTAERLGREAAGINRHSTSELRTSFTFGKYIEASMLSMHRNPLFQDEIVVGHASMNQIASEYPPVKHIFRGFVANKEDNQPKIAKPSNKNKNFESGRRDTLDSNQSGRSRKDTLDSNRRDRLDSNQIGKSRRDTLDSNRRDTLDSNRRATLDSNRRDTLDSNQSGQTRRSTLDSNQSSGPDSISERSKGSSTYTNSISFRSSITSNSSSVSDESSYSAKSQRSSASLPNGNNRLTLDSKEYIRTNRGPIPMDQLYLTDSVGKAGCKTRGYMIRPPENYMVTRNASEIKIKHIKRLEAVDNEKLERCVSVLQALGVLLMISGSLLCIFLMLLGINVSAIDFFREYLDKNAFTIVFILGGIFQPLVTGIYCIFTLYHLNHIRPYYLRIPITLMFPMGFFIIGVKYINSVNDSVEPYLQRTMRDYIHFQQNHYVLDGLQSSLSCCGIKSSFDWKSKLNVTGKAFYPKSCCRNEEEVGCPNFAPISSFHPDGCANKLENFHLGVGIFMCVMALLQFIIEVVSIYWVKTLYELIKDEMDDPRPTCKILMGKCFSICESGEYERQQELAELGMLKFENTVRPLPAHAFTIPPKKTTAAATQVSGEAAGNSSVEVES